MLQTFGDLRQVTPSRRCSAQRGLAYAQSSAVPALQSAATLLRQGQLLLLLLL